MRAGFRYSRWDGTQDPWADADDVLESLSDDILEFGDLSHALRRMLQRGFSLGGQRITGLQSLMERLRAMRRRELGRYDADSVVRRIEEQLREVRSLERAEVEERLALREAEPGGGHESEADDPLASLAGEADAPPFGQRLAARRRWLDGLEGRPADALRGLSRYDFLSPEAEARFRRLVESLRRQVVQQYFQGAAQALGSMSPEDLRRLKAMLAELNEMIRRQGAGQPYDFDGFMDRYGDLFPERPGSLEELLEALARRAAAAAALMASMTPEMRRQLSELVGALLADPDLDFQLQELARALRQVVPGDFWDRAYRFEGDEPLELSGALDVLRRIQDAESLERYLRSVTRPSDLDEVDLERVAELLGSEAARDLRRLRAIERLLEEAGYVQRAAGRLQLTPAGTRRIGQQALGRIYRRLQAALSGEHEIPRVGRGGEVTGELKPFEWGDPFHIQVKETVFEAVRRSGAGTPVRIRPEDFVVERTEERVQAATALLIDLSLSMPMRGNWVAAKKVALALHALISAMFPRDRLFVIGFSDYARRIAPEELPGLGWEEVYGTNMQHALLVARRLLSRHRQAARQILLVTDGEPTAHLEGEEVFFAWPPVPKTFEETLKEVARCTREGIVINTFMLDRSPYLVRFVERIAALNRGRAFFTSADRLGEYILADYLESRRQYLAGA